MQGPSSYPGNDDITREEPLQWGFTCFLLTALSCGNMGYAYVHVCTTQYP